jgi:hypothetical protein
MARKPAALARELLRNFPKGRRGKGRRRRKAAADGAQPAESTAPAPAEVAEGAEEDGGTGAAESKEIEEQGKPGPLEEPDAEAAA